MVKLATNRARMDPYATYVSQGKQRGVKYEIYFDGTPDRTGVPPAKPYVAVVYSPYISSNGSRGVEAEAVGRGKGPYDAVRIASDHIELEWKQDQQMIRRGYPSALSENPLASSILLLLLGGAAAIGGLIYWASKTTPSPPLLEGSKYHVVARAPAGSQDLPHLATLAGWNDVQGKGVVADASGLVFEFTGTWSGHGTPPAGFSITSATPV
jgi:hypothetical protein